MNIYQIQQDLLEIFDALEENGGELTPELEEKLSIKQEEFKDKIESYVNVVKKLEGDIISIKAEETRLKALKDKKNNTIDRLKKVIITAVNNFGDTKKTGGRYIDYGIGEVSVRKTPVAKIDDNLVKTIGESIQDIITHTKQINHLDVYDRIRLNDISDYITKDNFKDTMKEAVLVSNDDLSFVDVNLELTVPLKDISNSTGYTVVKEIAKYTDNYKLTTSIPKAILLKALKENGYCAPHLAKLDTSESLTIK